MKTRIALMALCVLGALPTIGCGSDDEDTDQSKPPPPATTNEAEPVTPPDEDASGPGPRGSGMELLEKPQEVSFEHFGFRYGVRVVAAETATEIPGRGAPPGEEFVLLRLDITNKTDRKAQPVLDVIAGALTAFVKEHAATDENTGEPQENLPGFGEAGCRKGWCRTGVEEVEDEESNPFLTMSPYETVPLTVALEVKESRVGPGDLRLVLMIPRGTTPKSGRLG